jgi:xylitol oxidase
MRTNWAGNLTYRAAQLVRPTSLEALQELVAREPRLRVLGSRHSFNDIADTDGVQVSLDRMPQHLVIDDAAASATVSGGALYGDVSRALHRHGWALANLASLPHLSIAGAVSTGTHGSGDRNLSLAGAVRGLELVGSKGEVRRLTRGDADFDGSVVALGALGVVIRVALDIEPSFDVAQTVFTGLPWDSLDQHFDAITSQAYSASFFTRWVGAHVDQVWLKYRAGEGNAPLSLHGATPATSRMHMLAGGALPSVTTQGGQYGPWLDRLPHFRMEFTPSSGAELQSEYLLPRANAASAFAELRRLGPRIAPLLQVCEIRTVAADSLWLSGSYERKVAAIHFTWQPDSPAVLALLPTIEDALLPLGARPHWGKCFTVPGHQLADLYPRFADFQVLVAKADPGGTFNNTFLDRVLWG